MLTAPYQSLDVSAADAKSQLGRPLRSASANSGSDQVPSGMGVCMSKAVMTPFAGQPAIGTIPARWRRAHPALNVETKPVRFVAHSPARGTGGAPACLRKRGVAHAPPRPFYRDFIPWKHVVAAISFNDGCGAVEASSSSSPRSTWTLGTSKVSALNWMYVQDG